MTEPQAQPDPQPAPQAQPETTDTANQQNTVQKKPQVRWIIAGAAVLVLLLCFGGCSALLATSSGEEPSDSKAASAAPQAHPTTSAPTTAAAPTTASATTAPAFLAYDTPTKSDFKLKVKVLKKQCFGSAGCNITYRIGVTYTGDGDLDPSKTYEVTYQVKGAEDPIINTFEVTGDSASVQEEEMASTKRSSDKLTAVVTDVSEF